MPTLLWLREHKLDVVVIGPAQEYDTPLPMLLAYSLRQHNPDLAEKHLLPHIGELDRTLAARMKVLGFTYLSPWQTACARGRCQEYAGTQASAPMLSDTNHYTTEGALALCRAWISRGLFAGKMQAAATAP